MNLKVIQEIMGHGNIHMTMDVYAQSNEKKNSLSLLQYEKKILGE